MTQLHGLPDSVYTQTHALAVTSAEPIAAFIYDLDQLRQHVQGLMAALPAGVELFYAIKANSEPEILDCLAPLVHGFEISSGGEIDKVLHCALRKPFIFSGPAKLNSDLRTALQQHVDMIHVESLTEIARLAQIAKSLRQPQKVLIRINPVLPAQLSTKLSMAGVPTPFGIEEAQLAQAIEQVENSEYLTLSGFHIHAMSHQLEVTRHQQLIDWYLQRWTDWRALAKNPDTLEYLNVGGGMGVNYLGAAQFDWQSFCQHLDYSLQQLAQPPRIRLEPGRFLTAFCGYYAIQVMDIKLNHGQDFAVCRGGTHQFRLPAAQAHDHPIIHLPLAPRAKHSQRYTPQPITVVGQLCTPKDILSRQQLLSDVRIGDVLVLPLAGAYGYNISHSDFLCHPKPLQLFIDSNALPLHRKEHYVATLAE